MQTRGAFRWVTVLLILGCGSPILGDDGDDTGTPDETGEPGGDDDSVPPEETQTVGDVCSPREESACPGTHYCCSDDPAAPGGSLPAYRDDIPDAEPPLFSAQNNGFSSSGLCVRLDDVPCGGGLGELDDTGMCSFPNCPVPCNPTWSSSAIAQVCGAGRQCCQTRPIEADDCVLDDGVWRPVTGVDIPAHTQWRAADHSTHQDPNGRSCTAITGSMDISNPAFRDCLDQLSVANQRGWCMPSCPDWVPPGPNACDELNG